jgi:hypothetical protein
VVAGVQRLAGDDFTAGLPAPAPQKPVQLGRRERLVDPGAVELTDRVYNRLEDAVLAADTGDVILIRCRGRLPVGPIRPERKAIDLTIRPAPGFRPELVVTSAGGAAALFNFRDGWLRLEDLEIRLEPSDDVKSLAVVALGGSGQCSLKGCAVTLDRPPNRTDMALALAAVPESVGAVERPQLSLEGCFVRGDGDVVRDRSGRAFELRAKNTLAVLNGSFLCIESGAEAAPPGQWVQATLAKVTAYLTDNLVRLQASKDQRMPVPVHCDARACLFVAAAGRALVHLDGPETREDQLHDRLTWTGEGNAFGNLKDRMFDQVEPGDEMKMAGPTVGAERWRSLFKEDDNSHFLPVVHFAESAPEAPFARVKSPQMRPRTLKEVGADLAVPMPADDDR